MNKSNISKSLEFTYLELTFVNQAMKKYIDEYKNGCLPDEARAGKIDISLALKFLDKILAKDNVYQAMKSAKLKLENKLQETIHEIACRKDK